MYIMFDSAVDILYKAETVFCTKYDPVYCVTLTIMFIQCIICTLSGVFINFYSAIICLCVIFQGLSLPPSVRGLGSSHVVSELWLSLVLEYNILMNSSEIEPVVFYDGSLISDRISNILE